MTKMISDDYPSMGGNFIKAAEFEGGLELKVNAEVEKTPNTKFGAEAGSTLVKNDILKEGEIFRYHFLDAEGNERTFDTSSAPFFIAMRNADPEVGDAIFIERTGQTTETRYSAEVRA